MTFSQPDSRCPGSISAELETDIEGELAVTFTTAFIAAALAVPSMSPPEYGDCEVVTNCVFDTSRGDAKMFALKIELDATSSNGVEAVFGRDADGDGRLSRTEAEMSVGYCCGEWKVANLVTGDKFSSAGTSGRTALDWKLRLNGNRTPRSLAATVNGQPAFTQLVTPPPFLFDPTWNAAKIIRRGQSDPNLQVVCSVDNIPLVIRLR